MDKQPATPIYKIKFLQALKIMIRKRDAPLPAHTDAIALFNALYQKA